MTHAYIPLSLLLAPAAIAVAESPVKTEQEQNLEDLIASWEDLAVALDAVRDVTDADLVAARVAGNILLIRRLNTELEEDEDALTMVAHAESLKTRSAEAAKTAEAAVARLKSKNYYESDALKAALFLVPLVAPEVRPGPDMAAAVAELQVNYRETVIELLYEVEDAESAAVVAELLEIALAYGEALDNLGDEIGNSPMDEEQKLFIERRMDDYELDLKAQKKRLKQKHYYGCSALKKILK